MSLRLFSWLFLVLPAVLLVACDSTPTAPSPTVSVEESGQRPSLGCATDLELFINNLGPTPVPFSGPTLQSLGEVDKSSCTPVSGSDFPLGTTPVTCSATEADDLVQSCSFSVTVLARAVGRDGLPGFWGQHHDRCVLPGPCSRARNIGRHPDLLPRATRGPADGPLS